MILSIIDEVKSSDPKMKGLDVTRTYLDLFAHNLGEGVIEVKNEQDFAFRAGFTANDRGLRSWKERLLVLETFGFIKVQRLASNRIDFILLVHPRKVVKHLYRTQRLTNTALWDTFRQSLADFDPDSTDPDEPLEGPREETKAPASGTVSEDEVAALLEDHAEKATGS